MANRANRAVFPSILPQVFALAFFVLRAHDGRKASRSRCAAYFSIAGLAVVMFAFFGVACLLPGLRAYA